MHEVFGVEKLRLFHREIIERVLRCEDVIAAGNKL